jgi:glyoxylase-like metal-dependent hydrolase (beta-lactamase superfamily II)/8-oxo-dGTP pyrophosphatase MutT (NUDIX family)
MTQPVTPKDAAAMILLRDPEDPKVFWVRRSLKLSFMGGYHAFPGGQRDVEDFETRVLNCQDLEAAAMRACAAREIFEETGVLVARGVERLTVEQRAALRRELNEGRIKFAELLEREELALDAELLVQAPRWVTPPSSPRRFNTWFFTAWLPEGQETEVIPGELESGEWLSPGEALRRWRDGECLIASPILDTMQALDKGIEGFIERMMQVPQAERDEHQRIELRSGFLLFPVRTPTLPPATHTNCYIIGGNEVVVIDPASPYEDEQQRLDALIASLINNGCRVREIIITHLHQDHIGGVMHLSERFGLPVAAHRITAEALEGMVRVDRFIEDNDLILLDGEPGWRLRAMWTPGHARGHLCFYEERTGTIITGDLVVGFGTVVIAPPEGNMSDYLASLRRLLDLPKLTALFPAHGPSLINARGKIEEYIAHRLEREAKIVSAMTDGAQSIPEIVKAVYTDVPEAMHKLAECSVLAHLEKLESEDRVGRQEDAFVLI